jgi:RNA polymerase sigma-70 factor (ECF subfamily)
MRLAPETRRLRSVIAATNGLTQIRGLADVESDDKVGRAIEHLYREQAAAFGRMAAAIAGAGAASDAVQEGFARAYARRGTYRARGSLAAWVWRIVLRAALDAHGAPQSAALEDLPDLRLPFPERDPDLASAVLALSPRRRTVVFLRYFADLPLREIAEVLEIAEGTVSATLAQARDELHAALTEITEVRP